MTARVVLLHGLAGSPRMWQQLRLELPTEWCVTAPLLPWHAAADGRWAHRPGDASAALAGSHRDGDVLVAHSFAATLLLAQLASRSGPQPAGVVLVSPFYRNRTADFDWSTITHYLVDFHEILAEGVRVASRRSMADDLLMDIAVVVRARVGPYAWTRFFEAYLATPTLNLGGLRQPVHVVHGVHDAAALLSDAHALRAALPDARLVEAATSGHFPMLDDAPLLARVVAAAVHQPPAPSRPVPEGVPA